jgi:hypothetical protein
VPGLKNQGLREFSLPVLPRETEHEIKADRTKPGRCRVFNRRTGLGGSVAALEQAQQVLVK